MKLESTINELYQKGGDLVKKVSEDPRAYAVMPLLMTEQIEKTDTVPLGGYGPLAAVGVVVGLGLYLASVLTQPDDGEGPCDGPGAA